MPGDVFDQVESKGSGGGPGKDVFDVVAPDAGGSDGGEKEAPLSLRGVGKAFLKQGIGGAKRLAGDAYSGLQTYTKYFQGTELPNLPEAMVPHGKEEETGSTLAGVGEVVPAVMAGGEALAARMAAKEGPPALEAIANKIPKIHPFAKFLAKRIPGVGTAIDILEATKAQYGSSLAGVPKAGRDELAYQLYKETKGKLPTTAQERVDAIRELRESLRVSPRGKAPTATKAATATTPATPKPTAAPVAVPTTSGLGARVGRQIIKDAPPGDLRRQVFVNLKTALKGEDGGVVSATENKAFRALVEQKHGKRISAMTDAELDRVMRDVPKLAEELKSTLGQK